MPTLLECPAIGKPAPAFAGLPIPDPSAPPPVAPDAQTGHHDAVVAEIVGMIVAAIQDKGERNLAIGLRALEHARWQKWSYADYQAADYDRLMRRIREDVRLYVPIKPESIRIDDWAIAAELRELLRPVIGESVGHLSYCELRILAPKAMTFCKADVGGELRVAWVETIRGIVNDRAVGRTVKSADFLARVRANAERIAADRAGSPVVVPAIGGAEREAKAQARAKAEANASVTTALHDALGSRAMTPEQALAVVEAAIRSHDLTVPSYLGFDPATATEADCDTLAATMEAAGRVEAIRRLRDTLAATLDRIERGRRPVVSPAAFVRL